MNIRNFVYPEERFTNNTLKDSEQRIVILGHAPYLLHRVLLTLEPWHRLASFVLLFLVIDLGHLSQVFYFHPSMQTQQQRGLVQSDNHQNSMMVYIPQANRVFRKALHSHCQFIDQAHIVP